MLEWVIIGGGVHGTYLSNYLLTVAGVDLADIAVVDPHDEPLAVWQRCTATVGMRYLRSPAGHNLDVGSGALQRFAQMRSGTSVDFLSKYQRPSLRLFNSHCRSVIEGNSLASLRHRAQALSLLKGGDGFVLKTTSGELNARRVVLSLGNSDSLEIPGWAKSKDVSTCAISHAFSPELSQTLDAGWNQAVVVGGGLSAAQLALSFARQKPGKVTLVHRKGFQTRQFDADPCWLEERCLKVLRRQSDFTERRRIVDSVRNRATIPEDVRKSLELAIRDGKIISVNDSVVSAKGDKNSVRLSFVGRGDLECDLVVLATGFERKLPGGQFLHSAIENLNLRCASCGFPVVDEYLRWVDGLYVTGSLAELALGPASRNIVGAKLASSRIVSAETPSRHRPRELDYYYFSRRRTG